MDRYWDRSEWECAGLIREQVEALLTVELMEKGVVRVEQPELEPVEEVKPATVTIYGISCGGRYGSPDVLDFGFETIDLADAFTKLKPLKIEKDYGTNVVMSEPMRDLAVVPRDLPTVAEAATLKSRLDKAAAAKKANKERMDAYNAAVKAVTEATSGVWDDWQECRAKDRKYMKIKTTMAEYVGICGGNTETALAFLEKAFSAEEIAEATNWFGSLT